MTSKIPIMQTLGIPYRSLLRVFNAQSYYLSCAFARETGNNLKNQMSSAHSEPRTKNHILLSFQSKFFPGKSKSEPFLQEKKFGLYWFGGGEGNRTPVRKHAGLAFSERIHGFGIPLSARPMAGLRLR